MAADAAWLEAVGRLARATDRRGLARLAVEAARDLFGVERCSVWLIEGNIRCGTSGTNLQGHTVDESMLRHPLGPTARHAVTDNRDWELMPFPSVAEDGHKRVEYAWSCATPLRVGERPIGVMYNDRAISGGDVDPEQQDRLAAFGGVVAQLLDRLRQIEEAGVLAQLGAELTGANDYFAVAQAVGSHTCRMLRWDRFCFAYVCADGRQAQQVGVSRQGETMACRLGKRLDMAAMPAAMAPLLSGEPVLLNEPTSEQVHPDCPGVGAGCAVYQPIVSLGQVLGLFTIVSEERQRYADTDLQLLAAVAATVSPALHRINETQRAVAVAADHAALVEAIPDLTLIYDRDGVCLAVPSPERLIVAGGVEDVLGKCVTDVFGPAMRPVVEAVRRAIDGERTTPVRYELARGERRVWFEGRAVSMGDRALWMARDITEVVQAEERLREARRALDQAAEMSKVGAWMHDLASDRQIWSQSMCRLHGLPDASLSITVDEVMRRFGTGDDAERIKEAMRAVVSGGGRLDATLAFRRADGSARQARMVADVQRDPDGRPTHVFGMMQDITEQVQQQERRAQLEAQLAQASKMEAIGQLAGGVAHDFNNLLTTINGYAEFLLGDLPPDSVYRDDLEEIRRAAQRAASLTRQLLAFSRRSLIKPTDLDLNRVVRDMERMLARLIGEHIELEVVLSPESLNLRADAGQVEQIVMNLAVNAKDAMRGGGRLTIATGHAALTTADLGPLSEVEPGEFVTIAVGDTGCGMAPEVLARAFEPFFTTKPVGEGAGLGLASVYGAVRQNRGHITCQSEVGVGTQFVVYLPRLATPTPEPGTVELASRGGAEHILLVEDDPAVRGFVARSLRLAGYNLQVADSGSHALRVAETGAVDLLLTDVIMPGMNGLELATQLGAQRPDMRVLFMSGYTAAIIEQQGLAPSRAPLLVKPFGARELLARVRDLLDH